MQDTKKQPSPGGAAEAFVEKAEKDLGISIGSPLHTPHVNYPFNSYSKI